jgi:hypothetical protein
LASNTFYMRFSSWLPTVTWLSISALLPACSQSERCPLLPGTRYEGEGLVVLRENVAQDGSMFVVFYPVCHVDTLHLLHTLRQAPEGFFISAYQRDVLKAIRHRSVVLRDLDKRRPSKNPRYYITSVHLAFVYPPDYTQEPSKPFPYRMATDQGRIEHLVQSLTAIHPSTFHSL